MFRHTDYSYEQVGIQVPAGTIRAGEAPEAAAVREAIEETGLTGLRVVRKLGVAEYDMSPYRPEIQRRHVFLLELTEPAPAWFLMIRPSSAVTPVRPTSPTRRSTSAGPKSPGKGGRYVSLTTT